MMLETDNMNPGPEFDGMDLTLKNLTLSLEGKCLDKFDEWTKTSFAKLYINFLWN
ncbi:MAG: hypothetical protein IPK10_18495 [Bacteroidetes bacterium]|nr:hypothetical protein [Bacteroidota bacterium]